MTSKWIDTKSGFHRKVRTVTYGVLLCSKSGRSVKAVLLENQISTCEVWKTLKRDYPDWNVSVIKELTDRDFSKGEKI